MSGIWPDPGGASSWGQKVAVTLMLSWDRRHSPRSTLAFILPTIFSKCESDPVTLIWGLPFAPGRKTTRPCVTWLLSAPAASADALTQTHAPFWFLRRLLPTSGPLHLPLPPPGRPFLAQWVLPTLCSRPSCLLGASPDMARLVTGRSLTCSAAHLPAGSSPPWGRDLHLPPASCAHLLAQHWCVDAC